MAATATMTSFTKNTIFMQQFQAKQGKLRLKRMKSRFPRRFRSKIEENRSKVNVPERSEAKGLGFLLKNKFSLQRKCLKFSVSILSLES